MAERAFLLRFWGVRGSIACPGDAYVRYGGNTSCVEVRCGGHLFILDAGTGLRELGRNLLNGPALDADILLSHTHLDHIIGVPFFRPLYQARHRFRLWAGHLLPDGDLMDALCKMMAAPLFPIPPAAFDACECRDFHAGETLEPRSGIIVRTAALNHPNNATGYRIEHAGRSICYVTDTEHRPGERDAAVIGLARDADIMIYDSTYTDEEYASFVGWGHSTWQEGVRLADAAGVKRLVIFHHDPSHDDGFMDEVAAQAHAARPGTLVAREGMTLYP